MKSLFLITISFICFGPSRFVLAQECFQFQFEDTPEAIPLFSPRNETDFFKQTQTWCYEQTSHEEQYIYNVEEGKVRGELAMLAKNDDRGNIASISHGSLLQNKVTFHRSRIKNFNPLSPVPASINEARRTGIRVQSLLLQSPAGKDEIKNKLKSIDDGVTIQTRLEPGRTSAFLSDEIQPYAGYWWPHGGSLYNSDMPITKYDAVVAAWTGTDPMAREWEAEVHSPTTVPWGGHCNGWAASSVLYKEIPRAFIEPQTGIQFLISDINGLLAEANFCVRLAFFGKRYWGPEDDINDISPVLFHQTVEYYIKDLKKPVAFDYMSDDSVDNSVMSGYIFDVTAVSGTTDKFDVTATIKKHQYDGARYESLGPAYYYNKTYTYRLVTDAQGEITDGQWTGNSVGGNPDFLWVPLAQANCGRENPRIKVSQIERLMQIANSQ